MSPIFSSLILFFFLLVSTPMNAYGSSFLDEACSETPEPETCMKYLSLIPESKNLHDYNGITKISIRAFNVWAKQTGEEVVRKDDGLFSNLKDSVCLKTCTASLGDGFSGSKDLMTAVDTLDYSKVEKLVSGMKDGMSKCGDSCRGKVKPFTDMSDSFMKLCDVTLTFAKLEGIFG